MLVFQQGYLVAKNSQQQINVFNYGIGGILRFYLLNNFTAGIYGGSQKSNYNSTGSKNSYLNIGHDSPFIGITKKQKKLDLHFLLMLVLEAQKIYILKTKITQH